MTTRDLVHRVLAEWRLRHNPIRVSFCRSKEAAKVDEIISGVDSRIVERAKQVTLKTQDHNRSTNTLRYEATSGGPTYTVVVRAMPEADDQKRVEEADVLLSCSCKHWRYGGCEYHAYEQDYLYQEQHARGTLDKPTIRDPEGDNYVCKHLYKALEKARKVYIDYEPPSGR